LGASSSDNAQHYMGLAADIAHTCHESYDRSGVTAVSLLLSIFGYWSSVVVLHVNSIPCLRRKTWIVVIVLQLLCYSPAVKPPILGDVCIRVRIKYFLQFHDLWTLLNKIREGVTLTPLSILHKTH